MPVALVAVIALAAAIVIVALALAIQSHRLSRRFSRIISPYERRREPGGEALDPEDWVRR